VTGKLHRSGRPERVDDYAGVGGELAERLRAVGIRSAVGAPIKVGGMLWGAIMVVSDRPFVFPADTEERIARFAELVTAALANADAREQLAASRARLVEAAYEERRRLERDLHDGAQQEFVSAAIALNLARRKWSVAPDEALALVDAGLERLQSGLRDLRELAAGIHPSVLSDRGLGAAVRALGDRSPVAVEVREVPAQRFPEAVETTAYFVVAEALTNAAKHARCRGAEVGMHVRDGRLVVEVRDDGVGGVDASRGSGLRGLADRVSALGGELRVHSRSGEGTLVRACIPLERQESAPAHGRSVAVTG
jgi:signal transduction histidine kinase